MSREYDIVTIVGNRPQFIKMAPISTELRKRGYKEYIVHTGQHFDQNMSEVFFEQLSIPKPDVHLHIESSLHGGMTGEMLIKLEQILLDKKPKGVLLYGDTNSTLAAALAAVKIKVPIAHVEAGPRIYDINTPEEINRIVADHAAALRFCPDIISVQNLAKENITRGVHFTGDVMFDSYLIFSEVAKNKSSILEDLELNEEYAVMTSHRPNNTGDETALRKLIEIFRRSPIKVIFPMHPRTKKAFEKFGLYEEVKSIKNVICTEPLGYLDMMQLVNHAKIILTDSGGLQKEAFYAGKPVCILFYATPWPQIEESGWQTLCWSNGIDVEKVISLIHEYSPKNKRPMCFGDGKASEKIVDILEKNDWLNN